MTIVRFSSCARAQVRAIETWWQQHRSSALFIEELALAIKRLAANPLSGPAHASADGVRRVLLRRSRFRVYYRFG